MKSGEGIRAQGALSAVLMLLYGTGNGERVVRNRALELAESDNSDEGGPENRRAETGTNTSSYVQSFSNPDLLLSGIPISIRSQFTAFRDTKQTKICFHRTFLRPVPD